MGRPKQAQKNLGGGGGGVEPQTPFAPGSLGHKFSMSCQGNGSKGDEERGLLDEDIKLVTLIAIVTLVIINTVNNLVTLVSICNHSHH